MKRVLSLILFFAVFALINGPPAYSMNDVDDNISIETVDSYVLPSIESEMILQPVCILSGGLDLKLPTTEVATYVELIENLWLCSQSIALLFETTEHSRLTNQSPDANSLAQTMRNEGPLRLEIYEVNVHRHFRKTYM